MDGLNSGMEETKKRNSRLEDRMIEITPCEQHTEMKKKKNQQSLWGRSNKRFNIPVTREPEGEEEEGRVGKPFN